MKVPDVGERDVLRFLAACLSACVGLRQLARYLATLADRP